MTSALVITPENLIIPEHSEHNKNKGEIMSYQVKQSELKEAMLCWGIMQSREVPFLSVLAGNSVLFPSWNMNREDRPIILQPSLIKL